MKKSYNFSKEDVKHHMVTYFRVKENSEFNGIFDMAMNIYKNKNALLEIVDICKSKNVRMESKNFKMNLENDNYDHISYTLGESGAELISIVKLKTDHLIVDDVLKSIEKLKNEIKNK